MEILINIFTRFSHFFRPRLHFHEESWRFSSYFRHIVLMEWGFKAAVKNPVRPMNRFFAAISLLLFVKKNQGFAAFWLCCCRDFAVSVEWRFHDGLGEGLINKKEPIFLAGAGKNSYFACAYSIFWIAALFSSNLLSYLFRICLEWGQFASLLTYLELFQIEVLYIV